MTATNDRIVTVFGGTGFLGRRVVWHLLKSSFSVRVASRHPERSRKLFDAHDPRLHAIRADIHDDRSIANAMTGAYAAVNAVSLYVEHGRQTFHSVHVEAAQRVAALARRAGVERFAHVSGIGADAASPSSYVRKRGEGEIAVRAAFPGALLLRPSVMFGPDDAFFTTILQLLRRLPAYPMFGRGLTKLQPAFVDDVAEAIVRALQRATMSAVTIECGGPQVYTYEQLLRTIARADHLEPFLVPVPFAAWHALALIAEIIPHPPITRNQVELMQIDNVVSPEAVGFGEFGISPRSVEEILQEILWDH
ncbi:MAG: complex I NDUFA9 subunit family protein [Rhizobiales bacterium]|nr:complex I NDUFA9 subunit family protein [Hyphomicrobiales bacterium]